MLGEVQWGPARLSGVDLAMWGTSNTDTCEQATGTCCCLHVEPVLWPGRRVHLCLIPLVPHPAVTS